MPPFNLQMPPMRRMRQRFVSDRLEDVRAATVAALERSGIVIPAGGEIAIPGGSRGIANYQAIMRAVVDWVRARGGRPFIVPAMGSHGGATAEGQVQVLADYGITPEVMGCEIRSSMEPVELPREECPIPVYFDRHAAAGAGTLVLNRVKIHTCFHSEYESGIMKMLAIGLGKHRQALAIHGKGLHGMRVLMPLVARQVLRHANVIGGIGIVENAYDETCRIDAAPADRIPEAERGWIAEARARSPGLPLDEIDILIVDRMGKNISGTGMDTNVIGRMGVPGLENPPAPRLRILMVRDLTPESHGNALGVGLADLCTRRLFDKIDLAPMYENLFTSTFLDRGKLPVVGGTDWETVAFAVRACQSDAASGLRILRIRDTLHLAEFHASPAAVDALAAHPAVTDLGGIGDPYFDVAGEMIAFDCGNP